MRRTIAEWGLVLSVVLWVAFALIWVDSLALRTLQEPLSVGSACFLRFDDGRVYLYTDLGADWKPATTGRDRPTRSWVVRYTTWFLPGLEYHHRLLANGKTIWSLELAMVIPVAILLFTMVILVRIKGGSWRIVRPLCGPHSRAGDAGLQPPGDRRPGRPSSP